MALLIRNACRSLHCFLNFKGKKNIIHSKVRTILSNAYYCREEWTKRLQTPTLRRVDAEDFALRLQEKFDREGKITPVDIDILANKLEFIPLVQQDFTQVLINKFRHTKSAVEVVDSTHHAVTRALLDLKEYSRLCEMLKDKIHYGIFLDYFSANMLMDHFIEQKLYLEAAEVAFDLMLQEDLTHPISRALAWYACHLLWKHPVTERHLETVTTQVDAEEEDDEEQEEKLIPVPFIENYFYDDHFDIPKVSQRLGKTLTMVSTDESLIGRSYQLIGWGLYEKFKIGVELLESWAESDVKEVICMEAIEDFRSRVEDIDTKELPEPKDPGEMSLEDEYRYITEEEKADLIEKCQKYSDILTQSGRVIDNYDCEEELQKIMMDVINKVEEHDIKECTKLYELWNSEREVMVAQQIQDYKNEQLKKGLQSRILQLKEKEEKLTFFENQSAIALKARLGRKEQEVDDYFESEEMQNWSPRT